jgi:hypothetical protein
VKPWLLPNIDPTQTSIAKTIFDPASGQITDMTLLGKGWPNFVPPNNNPQGLQANAATATPLPGQYYKGAIDAADFPAPTQALPACSTGFSAYQLAIAGCVPEPVHCGPIGTASIKVDTTITDPTPVNTETVAAAECLIHYTGGAGDADTIDPAGTPSPPFQFLGGTNNPVPSASGKDVLVSDSLVTVPVYDSSNGLAPGPTNGGTVTVIGFLQLFLNPDGVTLPSPAGPPANQLPVRIVNQVGCGTSANGTAILGNGASPVAVRLISQ